jgi:hypothetical protein
MVHETMNSDEPIEAKIARLVWGQSTLVVRQELYDIQCLKILSSGSGRRQDKELQRWTHGENSSSANCTLCENGCQVAGLATRINGCPRTCLNYATKANSQLRFVAPKGQVCRQRIVRNYEQLQEDGPSGRSGGFRLPHGRMQKQCTTQRSSRATVDAPK